MPWSTPLTAVSNAALTAAQWNASVRDNLNETAVAKATTPGSIFVATGVNSIAERIPTSQYIGTAETTTNTGYVNLTTLGPAITATTAGRALLLTSGQIFNNTAAASSLLAHQVSGATTLSASDTWALEHRDSGTNGAMNASRAHLETALNSGSNTFTVMYRVTGGTGTFQRRQIAIIPF